ncbi:DUF362 domain-containing protein [Chloroflexota bacterium]
MLKVGRDLCIGCGLCAQICPTGVISLSWDHAEIDHSRCNQCLLCLDVCPQGAIAMLVTVSKDDLQASIILLKQRTIDIIERIESLKQHYLNTKPGNCIHVNS